MIDFSYQTEFELKDSEQVARWIGGIIASEGFEEGDISYIFCDDDYVYSLNKEFLEHDTLTDIISFDYSLGKQIHGEIYISVDRVAENAENFKTEFIDELHRVIIHGILHLCKYKDKTQSEIDMMRLMEDQALEKRLFV